MKTRYVPALTLLSALLLTSLALAECPTTDLQAANVRRLLITNSCVSCDLVGADLSGAHLIGADLRGAMLQGADLSWVNLEGADLMEADLTGANLTGAFLTNASLAMADLDSANFSQAQLYYVDVTGASTENLDLAGATVVGTPISVGSDRTPQEVHELPVLSPDETRQLPPPSNPLLQYELLDVPELLNVPPEIMPDV